MQFDRCYFYYLTKNGFVALLEALLARMTMNLKPDFLTRGVTQRDNTNFVADSKSLLV